ncbi:MAG TPA: hypothetical protein VHQ91_09285 [Geminicoccaceae bacterium]|nr:hypothetical protein [Geminicoccaceae bacterium]
MARQRKPAQAMEQSAEGAPRAPVTAILLDQGCILLLLAAGDGSPPASGTLQGADGSWLCLAWEGSAGPAALGLLRAGGLPLTGLQGLSVCPPEPAAPWRLPEIGRVELEPEILVEHVRATAGQAAAVFNFLRLALLEGKGLPAPARVREFLQRFLFAVSHQDGFIEILGVPECGGLFVQGWSQRLTSGQRELGLVAGGFNLTGCILAAFDRADLLPPARGLVGFAKDIREIDLGAVRALFFELGAELLRLDVVGRERILLGPPEVLAHVGAMLGRLQAEPAILRGFKRVCRPRFQDVETVSALAAPIRLVADLVVAAAGAGILVLGWLLDPERRTKLVLLKSTRNFYLRLSEHWVRLARPDVTEAFAAEAAFRNLLLPHDRYHGFIAFAPRQAAIEPGERFYLELVLEDESCAFLPLALEQGTGPRHLPRILGSIDAEDPEVERVLALHLAPFTAAVRASRARPPMHGAPLTFGRPERRAHQVSVIMPLAGEVGRAEVPMACLADDPDFSAAEFMFVTGRGDAGPIARRLAHCAEFYRLRGRLLCARDPLDFDDALALGAEAAAGELLLVLAPSVLPARRGWLARLIQELERAPDRGLVCPTLLYEDESIRYAGNGDGPSPSTPDRFAGYPSAWLRDGAAAASVGHGPAECFLVRRSLFLEIARRPGPFVGVELYHLELARRLRGSGYQCVWVPDVQLYAVDDQPAQPDEHWRRVGRLVDRRVLEQLSGDPVNPSANAPGDQP